LTLDGSIVWTERQRLAAPVGVNLDLRWMSGDDPVMNDNDEGTDPE
jgi:hypothetical protein